MHFKVLVIILISFFKLDVWANVDSLNALLQTDLEKEERVEVLHELVWYLAPSDHSRSLELANQALHLSLTTQNKDLIATSYNRIGLAYDYGGQLDEALQYYNQSLSIRKDQNDPVKISAAYNNIGAAYYYKGVYDKAIENYFESLKIREGLTSSDKPTLVGQSYNNIALVFKSNNKYAEALDYYRKSLAIKEQMHDKEGMCTSLSNMGVLFLELNEVDSSRIYLNQALLIAEDIESEYNTAMIKNNLALVYVRQNDLNKSEKVYKELIALQENKEDIAAATARVNLANVYLEQGKYGLAIEEAEIVLSIGQQSGSLVLQSNALSLLEMIHEEKGDYKQALDYHKKGNDISDSIYNIESNAQFSELLIEYETTKKQDSIALLNYDNQLLEQKNQLSEEEIEKRTWIAYLLGIGGLFLIIALLAVVRNYRIRKKAILRENLLKYESFSKEIDALRTRLEQEMDDEKRTDLSIDPTLLKDYLNNPLSDRELDVLTEVAKGKSNKEIAETLFVSVNTIKTHILNIYDKLDVQNRTQAAVKAGYLQIVDKR